MRDDVALQRRLIAWVHSQNYPLSHISQERKSWKVKRCGVDKSCSNWLTVADLRIKLQQNCIYGFRDLEKSIGLRGAVSLRFSQGLLNLMCNNSKSKADINFFLFFCCIDKDPKSITGCKILWFNTRWLCYSVWGKTPVFHNSGFIFT